ncbi:MAG: polysaccharide pyruvyl transferase family protein [Pseudomonadota bacterium]
MKNKQNIGVFGHYGNKNLGDEAIISSMIENLLRLLPKAEISCLSINPFDSARRYNVKSFPIRYRADFFKSNNSQAETKVKNDVGPNIENLTTDNNTGKQNFKKILKSIPVLGFFIKSLATSISLIKAIKNECFFLRQAHKFIASIDLLVICGSNQLLDNFGGSWGFPYTLLKWTLLGKLTNTKVAFVSVGAGPLTKKLSYSMLKIALNKADYISYRDKGSKELIESRIKNLNGGIYPDIAQGLSIKPLSNEIIEEDIGQLVIGLNPMPVYDKRYWAVPDDEKYKAYTIKMADLCAEILNLEYKLKLFITQVRDADVIDDILKHLSKDQKYNKWESNIVVVHDETVDGLVSTITSCDIIIATRFHATIIPLQLNIPVLGICYYRKSSEVLSEMGLGDYYVQIDDFNIDDLKNKFHNLINNKELERKKIEIKSAEYRDELNHQYDKILKLIR